MEERGITEVPIIIDSDLSEWKKDWIERLRMFNDDIKKDEEYGDYEFEWDKEVRLKREEYEKEHGKIDFEAELRELTSQELDIDEGMNWSAEEEDVEGDNDFEALDIESKNNSDFDELNIESEIKSTRKFVTASVLEMKIRRSSNRFLLGTQDVVKAINVLENIYGVVGGELYNASIDSKTIYKLESDNMTKEELREELKLLMGCNYIRYFEHIITGKETYTANVDKSFEVVYTYYNDNGANGINKLIDALNNLDQEEIVSYMIGFKGEQWEDWEEKKSKMINRHIPIPNYPNIDD